MTLPPLVYIATLSIGFVFVLGLVFLNRLEENVRPLVVLFGVHAGITGAQWILAFQRINNLWTSHVYNIIEVIMVLAIMRKWVPSGSIRNLMTIGLILYGAFWVIAKIFLEQFRTTALFTPPVSRIVILVAAMIVLVHQASRAEALLFRQAKFWLAAGFLISSSGSLMFYGLRPLIEGFSIEAINMVFSINWSVMIVSNLMFVMGILCKPQDQNSGGQLEPAQ